MKIDKEFVRDLVELELKTTEGKINFWVSVLTFVLVAGLTILSGTVETFVRIFDGDYTSGTPTLQLILAYILGNGFCVAVLALIRIYLGEERK